MTTTAAPPVATVSKQSFLTSGMLIVIAIALAKLLLHCFFNNRYGYFRLHRLRAASGVGICRSASAGALLNPN